MVRSRKTHYPQPFQNLFFSFIFLLSFLSKDLSKVQECGLFKFLNNTIKIKQFITSVTLG